MARPVRLERTTPCSGGGYRAIFPYLSAVARDSYTHVTPFFFKVIWVPHTIFVDIKNITELK